MSKHDYLFFNMWILLIFMVALFWYFKSNDSPDEKFNMEPIIIYAPQTEETLQVRSYPSVTPLNVIVEPTK